MSVAPIESRRAAFLEHVAEFPLPSPADVAHMAVELVDTLAAAGVLAEWAAQVAPGTLLEQDDEHELVAAIDALRRWAHDVEALVPHAVDRIVPGVGRQVAGLIRTVVPFDVLAEAAWPDTLQPFDANRTWAAQESMRGES